MTTYLEKLREAQARNNSWLCVGLDPDPEKLPIQATHQWDEPVLPFCKAIVDATADIACAFKPNLGFFLQWGAAGIIALERAVAYIPKHIPVIIDCKAGDIGHTQAAWAKGLFDEWGVDAFVVNPFVGGDAVLAAVQNRPEKGIYVLAHTSNPSAKAFQGSLTDTNSLAYKVMSAGREWTAASQGTIGFVVGATYPAELEAARAIAPAAPFLIPGVGAQGGSLEAAVIHGPDQNAGPLISSSRGIIYAGRGYDFAEKAREAAKKLRQQINQVKSAES